jgi:flagellar biogenesis protein FliO
LGTTKQLRVSETVSLGEKRFVAILHVENRKFLIGGGASSVTLLTQLDAVNESVNSSASEPLPRSRGVY